MIEIPDEEGEVIEIPDEEGEIIEIPDEEGEIIEIPDEEGEILEISDPEETSSSGAAGDGEEGEPIFPYDELTVGTTTPFEGNFFTSLWGNAVSDLDVRTLIHGHNLVEWRADEGAFGIDPSVVSGITVTESPAGDHTYTLQICDDLFYSDGTPITAADYAFSLLLTMSPEIEALGGEVRQADYLLGYGAYRSGKVPYLSGVRLLGERLFSITVNREYLPFFYEVGLLNVNPYPIHVIAPGCRVADEGQGVYITNIDPEILEPLFTEELLRETLLSEETGYLSHPSVTSGPYRLLSFDGETAEFEINPYYKGNSGGSHPSIEKLHFTQAENETMIEELAKGNFGLLNKGVEAKALQKGMKLVSSGKTFGVSNYTRNGLSLISFCLEKETVADPAVRKAIALAFDKDAFVRDYVGNFGLRVDGYYGMGQWMVQLVNGTLAYPLDPPEDETDETAEAEYEELLEKWEELSLDEVPRYDFDQEAAVQRLVEAGYVWNLEGGKFDPEKDEVRCKKVPIRSLEEGVELLPLELTLCYPEGNRAGEIFEKTLQEPLKEIGVSLTLTGIPMEELLKEYYRQQERDCDMIYLATNFDVVFDPSETFRYEEYRLDLASEEFFPAGTYVYYDGEERDGAFVVPEEGLTGKELAVILEPDLLPEESLLVFVPSPLNPGAIFDEELYRLSVELRRTEPGELLEYMEKWVELQERFGEILPAIPVYSNVYFDFYPRILHNYQVSETVTWGQAIIGAYLGDPGEKKDEERERQEALEESYPEALEESGQEAP